MSDPDTVWAQVAKSYTIHPETLAATAVDLDMKHPPMSQVPVEQARDNFLALHRRVNGADPAFAGTTEELDAGGVPSTVYRPDSLQTESSEAGEGGSSRSVTVIVYFHGGSLLVGSRETHDASLKALSEKTGAVIVSVEYRLLPCPTDPWAPFDDAVAATRWVMAHRELVAGGKGWSQVKVGLGGDSAGGQLVMGVTSEVQSGLDFLVLIYPTVDMNTQLPSCKEFETTPSFNTTVLRWRFGVTNEAISNDAENNPRLNAAVRKDLGTSPPAVIVLAQLDPLRDAGTTFGERLRAEGVLVRTHVIEGVPHGFVSLPGVYTSATAQTFAYVADFLRKFQ